MTAPTRCPFTYIKAMTFTDISTVLKDQAGFTSTHGVHVPEAYYGLSRRRWLGAGSVLRFLLKLHLVFFAFRTLLNRGRGAFPITDSPVHTSYRRIVDAALSPSAVTSLCPLMLETIEERLKIVRSLPAPDLVLHYALPITVRVGMHICGLPITVEGTIGTHMYRMLVATDKLAVLHARVAIKHIIYTALQGGTGRGLIGALMQPGALGQSPTPFEVVECVYAVLVGGPTTVAPLTGAVLADATHDAAVRYMLLDEQHRDDVIEEYLRRISPLQATSRTATATGQRVVLDWAAANSGRTADNHIAFGYGVHHCPGARLARVLLPMMVAAALQQIPPYAVVDGGVRRAPDPSIGGLLSVPIRFLSSAQ
jgi:cytochrome P450